MRIIISNNMRILHLFPLLYSLLLLASGSTGRPYQELISDGLVEIQNESNGSNGVLSLHSGASEEGNKGNDECEQMYGFLPCSESVSGHVFMILVYEYLLFQGESFVASGGEKIFKILGPGVFGACAFQIIGSLPEALILLASGLLNSKEVAQELVSTGVGLVVGSSILLLTLLWGTCVILGSQCFPDVDPPAIIERSPVEKLLSSIWPGYGVVTDCWTCYSARIMLFSVIPLATIQIPGIFDLPSFWERVFIVATLLVSVMFLLSYFFYQIFQPWIQRRRLLYIKHGHLVVDILKHIENHTMKGLFTEDGAPNLSVIRSIFDVTDKDGDNALTAAELKDFLGEITFRRSHSDNNKVTDEILKEFDTNRDRKIGVDEFVKGMEKWIGETTKDSGTSYNLNEVLRPWIEKKKEERKMMKNIVPEILEHFQNLSAHGNLVREDGIPNVASIKRLFKEVDLDRDGFISQSELRGLTTDIKFGKVAHDTEDVVSKIMEELDVNGDQLINEEEFVSGLSKWLDAAYTNQTPLLDKNKDDYHENWEKTDKFVENKFMDKSLLAWTKAISLVALGIVILGLLAEPLIHSVQNLSTSVNIPSFFIAFVFVPLATNARIAVSAIGEARKKKTNITSLTLSEIYGTVLVNNLLGFSVLLSLIYFRGLSWNFSVEILVVLMVTSVMGCIGSISTVFPVWTSGFGYLLYPLSLVMVYVLDDFNWV